MATIYEQELNFTANLIKKISENKQFCDAKLILGDDEYVFVNKMVLGMVCPKFAEIFSGTTKTAIVKELNESELGKVCFKLVLEFIYKGFINTDELTDEQIIGVYAMSQEFKFRELTNVVAQALYNIDVTLENVGKLFQVAYKDEQNSKESGETVKNSLLHKCWQFLDNNSEIIVQTREVFQSFPYELVLEIVKRDTFYAEEIEIFNAVVEWGKSHPDEDIKAIMPHLRLKLISVEQFAASIRATELITDNDYFTATLKKTQERTKQRQPLVMSRKPKITGDCSMNTMNNNLATEMLVGLLFDDRFSDVKFKFKNDKETISAHKVILAAACAHFEEMFKSELQCSDMEVVQLDVQPKLFRIVLDFIHGKSISLSSLGENEIIELFTVAKTIRFTPMMDMVAKRVEKISVKVDNVAQLFKIASDNDMPSLRSNCVLFIENNTEAVISCRDTFAKLPIELVEMIVRKNINQKVFEALKEWKAQNRFVNLSNLFSCLQLDTLSPKQFAESIRSTGLISDEQYFEAHLNKDVADVSIVNTLCDTHHSTICKTKIRKIFSRCSQSVLCGEVSSSDVYEFSNEGESIFIEFREGCLINTIKFRLFDQMLRLYAYEVKVGFRKDNLEIVKHHTPGCYYASHQEITFQPKRVKFVQISSIESEPLEIYLESVQGLYNFGLDTEDSGQRQGGNLIACIPIDKKTQEKYDTFRCGDDEVVYILRYPCKVSTIGIQLFGMQHSQMKLFTKENVNTDWEQQSIVRNPGLSTVIIFKESLVSFIKLKDENIKNNIRCIECPATAKLFPIQMNDEY